MCAFVYILSPVSCLWSSAVLVLLGAGYLWWFMLVFHVCSGLLAQLIAASPPSRWRCNNRVKDWALHHLMMDMEVQKVKHHFATWAWMTGRIPKPAWTFVSYKGFSLLKNLPVFNELQAHNANRHLVSIYYLFFLFNVSISLQVLPRNCFQKRA